VGGEGLGGGGWKGTNCDKSQGQLSMRLAKLIDFITNLIRSGGGGGGGGVARCSFIISDCSDYARVREPRAIFHVVPFGTARP
jgi:hypothetical protein